MPFFKNTKDVYITGGTNVNVEGNQNIYVNRDKCTKRTRFDLPRYIILMIHLSYR